MSFTLRSTDILSLSQKIYINKILERFRMKDVSPSIVPIVKDDNREVENRVKCKSKQILRSYSNSYYFDT